MNRLLILLLGLTAVQAFIRPGYGGGDGYYGGGGGHNHYGGDNCEEHTKKPKTTTTTTTTITTTTVAPTTTTTVAATTPTTTTPRIVPECPEGFTLYNRTASSYNNNLGLWCMRVVPSAVNISVNAAAQVCQSLGASLTNYETEAERLQILAQAQAHIVGTLGMTAGSIATGGDRVAACQSLNRTWLEVPPCNNKRTLYELPASSHTNPEYTWDTWALPNEPNSQYWTYDVESCIQLHVQPGNAQKHGLSNDIFCKTAYGENDPTNRLFWNMGSLCGVFPTLSATA